MRRRHCLMAPGRDRLGDAALTPALSRERERGSADSQNYGFFWGAGALKGSDLTVG
jgi:hypothetical protein